MAKPHPYPRRFSYGSPLPWITVSCFLLLILWLGPLPAMSATSFTWHMVLHLGVAVLAGPLMGIGLVKAGLARWATSNMVAWAIGASLFEMLVVWSWHAPMLHKSASLSDSLFVAQQLSFLAAGTLIWLVAFAGRSKLAAGAGALAMLMTFMHMTLLGALLTLGPELLYEPFLYTGQTIAERLEDQRYGGILMAVGGSALYLVGGLVLAGRLIRE
ncbi:MAG: cytochrome c oxidase caa3-type, assembly factor CtaG-like protein [Alteromonadaceae bacterium]|nr:cytochrome c oxidase caa3-type, assembly factor CtaG-like protein [Alteromonadaceae bacterium]